MDSKYTIRLEPKEFAIGHESDIGHGRKRGVKDDAKDFGLSKGVSGGAIYWDGKPEEEDWAGKWLNEPRRSVHCIIYTMQSYYYYFLYRE